MVLSKFRNAAFATIAASALAFTGASMPKIAASHPAMLYVAGQLRMAMGDQEGGFHLLSMAAAARDQRTNQATPAAPNAAPARQPVKSCSYRPAPTAKASSTPKVVLATTIAPRIAASANNLKMASFDTSSFPRAEAFAGQHFEPKFVQIAQAHFPDAEMAARINAQVNQATAVQNASLRHAQEENAARLHERLQHVRERLERDNVPVPPEILRMTSAPAVVVLEP